MRISDLVAVMAGAGIGGGLRYAVGLWLAERWGTSFPWHTFFVNISGAFLLGIVMALSAERGLLSNEWRLFLNGTLNMFGSAAVGLVAVVAGLYVGRIV